MYSCSKIRGTELVVKGLINEACVSFCCFNINQKPIIGFSDDPVISADRITETIRSALDAGKCTSLKEVESSVLKGGISCPLFEKNN